MAKAVLTISSRNYGAWALRGWLMAKFAGLPFEEMVIPPDDPAMKAEILLLAPSMLVPALKHDDIEVWDTFVKSSIKPVSVGWELVRANPSPFSAPLLSNAAGILGVYVRKCDGSGWTNIVHTPFAVQQVSEYNDVAAGVYDWSGVFNGELPGTRVDPTYECGGYDTVVQTLIGPQTLRTNTTTEFAYVLANKL